MNQCSPAETRVFNIPFLMAGIDRFSIVTLVFFFCRHFLLTFFVIQPLKIPIRLPNSNQYSKQLYVPIDFNTAPILAIAILWASQCLGIKIAMISDSSYSSIFSSCALYCFGIL